MALTSSPIVLPAAHRTGGAPGQPSMAELVQAEWAVSRRRLDTPRPLLDPTPRDAGDDFHAYLADVYRVYRPLSRAESIAAGRAGDIDALVQSALVLVIDFALRARVRRRGQALMDLIGEGNLGLLRAAHKYDWRRGFKFVTYAYWWVRQRVWDEALRQDAPSGILSLTDLKALRTLRRERTRLERREGLFLSLPEVARLLAARDEPPPRTLGERWPDPAEVADWLAASSQVLYLSQPLDEALPSVSGSSSSAEGDWRPRTVMDLLVAAPLGVDHSIPARNAYQLARDVRALYADGALTLDEVDLLTLRYGALHPRADFIPPADWVAGATHSLRWVAAALDLSYSSTQRRDVALVQSLRLLTIADQAIGPAGVAGTEDMRLGAARRTLAALEAPAQVVQLSRTTTT